MSTSDHSAAEVLPTDVGYDRWSELYDAEDNPLIALEQPAVERLLNLSSTHRVLDVGCGTGRWSMRMAALGASVVALDFSQGMLARARAKAGAESVQFLFHDLGRPLPFQDGAFDRVICGLVMDHISHVQQCFSEMGRVCKPDGAVIISVMHPAMMLKGIQARFTDPHTGREVRPQSTENLLSDYVMGAVRGGLALEHLAEHVVDDDLAATSPRAAKYLGWPMLVTMRLRPSKREE